ncbi:nitroreductase family protein [Sporocytophaga myxococcoides]|uniref:nitroreductase family protein n=1 Tax=Sporocytophaga myxococcoides TaxID=153721 RepID=UPI0003FD59DD
MMTLLDNLKWRYAAKKMNGQQVPQEKLDYILEAARYAPSSSGLQPYKIFVISDRKKLEQIREFSFNQSQITDCSHLLVWAAWDSYSADRVGDVLLRTSRERGLPDNSSEDYKKMLLGLYEPLGKEWQENRCAKQAYISFGLAIAAAAEQKVDATPMEGFDNIKMDEFLGLNELGLKSVVILPIGYRDEANDWLVNLKKWRTPREEFVKFVG